jgi:hypothetical protein
MWLSTYIENEKYVSHETWFEFGENEQNKDSLERG